MPIREGRYICKARTHSKLESFLFDVFQISERDSSVLYDTNGWSGKLEGMKSLIVDMDGDLTDRITITHQVRKSRVISTINWLGISICQIGTITAIHQVR